MQVDTRMLIERHVTDTDGDDFGDACAGVVERAEQDMIPLSAPGGAVRCRENRLHLLAREVAEDGPVEPLGRNGKRALNVWHRRWILDGRIVQE
jgi:hypothetical protein